MYALETFIYDYNSSFGQSEKKMGKIRLLFSEAATWFQITGSFSEKGYFASSARKSLNSDSLSLNPLKAFEGPGSWWSYALHVYSWYNVIKAWCLVVWQNYSKYPLILTQREHL